MAENMIKFNTKIHILISSPRVSYAIVKEIGTGEIYI